MWFIISHSRITSIPEKREATHLVPAWGCKEENRGNAKSNLLNVTDALIWYNELKKINIEI